MAADDARIEQTLSREDELFLMANLFPKTTGLPLTIWVGPRAGARHDARLKVSATPGKMDLDDAVVAIRPEPRLLHGELSNADFNAIAAWIRLNEAALMDHWNGVTDAFEMAQALRRL